MAIPHKDDSLYDGYGTLMSVGSNPTIATNNNKKVKKYEKCSKLGCSNPTSIKFNRLCRCLYNFYE
jgi:hypothetical protein